MYTITSSPDISENVILQALSCEGSTPQKAANKRGARSSSMKRLLIMLGVAVLAIVAGVFIIITARIGGSLLTEFYGWFSIAAAPVIVILGFLAFLRKPKQDSPEKLLREFYNRILGIIPDYGKAYQLLSPNAMRDEFATAAGFTKKWKDNHHRLTSTLEDHLTEETGCSQCDNRARGIWAPVLWQIADKEIHTRITMMRCPECGEIYCPDCYLALDDRHRCRRCSKSLAGKPLGILMRNPEIHLTLLPMNDYPKIIKSKNDRVVELMHQITVSAFAKAWGEDELRPMGERGTMLLRATDTAVLIGDKWYLLAGDLGPLTQVP